MKALAIISRLFWPLVALIFGVLIGLALYVNRASITPEAIGNTALVLGGWVVLILIFRRKP